MTTKVTNIEIQIDLNLARTENFLMRLRYIAEFTNSIVEWLNKLKISFTEVDIEQSPEGAALVESLNNGNQMVPTLVFSDGTSMTNPSAMAVKEKLSAL